MKHHTAIILLLLSLLPIAAMAQNDMEYKLELGGGLGPSICLTDARHSMKHMNMMGGIIARRVFNARMVLKSNLAVAHVSGSSKGRYIPTDSYTPGAAGGEPTTATFVRNLVDAGTQFEFNFWGYGTGAGYKGYSPITPYLLTGVGVTMVFGDGKPNGAINFPVGVGVKYKVKPRVNIGMEWSMRFTSTDKLDYSRSTPQLHDPYNTHSAFMKNKDSYSFLQMWVTYDLCPKLRRCNN